MLSPLAGAFQISVLIRTFTYLYTNTYYTMPTLSFSIPNADLISDLPDDRTFTINAEQHGEADTAGGKTIWYKLIDYPATSLTSPVCYLIEEVEEAICDRYEIEDELTTDNTPANERPFYEWLKAVEAVSPNVQVLYEG